MGRPGAAADRCRPALSPLKIPSIAASGNADNAAIHKTHVNIAAMNFRHLLVGLTVLVTAPSAFAYVDPGSGMLLWQGLIAAVGMVLVFVRNPLQSIKRLLDRFKRK